MIIGNGMIASAFFQFKTQDDVIIFASGVSDSLEEDSLEFQREHQLLIDVRWDNPGVLLVYFSTCSIADPDRIDTPYVLHKLRMEEELSSFGEPYVILRLPVVLGHTNKLTTLPYFLYSKICSGKSFDLWQHAVRYPIDIDHVVSISAQLITRSERLNNTWNIAFNKYSVHDICECIASLSGHDLYATFVDKGSCYEIDTEFSLQAAKELGIEVGQDYMVNTFKKYLINKPGAVTDKEIVPPRNPAIAGGKPVRDADNPLIFGAPELGASEIAAVTDCLKSRWVGLGPRVAKFQQAFADYKTSPYALAVNSGSSALHLALLAVGVMPGDEVIAPTMTFIATTHAVLHARATPVLVDCDPVTLNIDVAKIEAAITARTTAIVVVHLYGRCCEMVQIMALAKKHNLKVVEDCAHAIESRYQGISAGLLGDVGCFSFYATKSITTGDGGMLTTSSNEIFRKLKTLSLHGMDLDAWSRLNGPTKTYEVTELGYKYNMTDMEAALGLVQLNSVETRWQQRSEHWHEYNRLLSGLPINTPEQIERQPASRHGYHLYTIQVDEAIAGINRDLLAKALKAENVGTGVHYQPVHAHPYYKKHFGYEDSDFPVASAAGNMTLSLPLNPEIGKSEIVAICSSIENIFDYYMR
ncbi:MAG: aminotransferase class I/II-fold pyridoxal phosphate-dependent enzyme [Immundisolibacteraceae bacterium]|nr:aminotransferase class I/II-fold pyridoxal phosphate-dependent enzyme [Immundisolibacteraceae bacterium]